MIIKSIFIFMLVLVLTAILIGGASANLQGFINISKEQKYRILPIEPFVVYKIEQPTNIFRDYSFFNFPFIS